MGIQFSLNFLLIINFGIISGLKFLVGERIQRVLATVYTKSSEESTGTREDLATVYTKSSEESTGRLEDLATVYTKLSEESTGPWKDLATVYTKSSEESTGPWEDLPTDCLISILERVDSFFLSYHVPRVCTSWNIASKNPRCWQVLDLSDMKNRIDKRWCNPIIKVYHVLKILRHAVRRSDGMIAEMIIPRVLLYGSEGKYFMDCIIDLCPNLKMLTVYESIPKDTYQSIPKHIKTWKRFWKDVGYFSVGSTTPMEISIRCKKIPGFSLWYPPENVLEITSFSSYINRLSIENQNLIRNMCLILDKYCSDLDRIGMDCGF